MGELLSYQDLPVVYPKKVSKAETLPENSPEPINSYPNLPSTQPFLTRNSGKNFYILITRINLVSSWLETSFLPAKYHNLSEH